MNSYTYIYDKNNNLIEIKDNIHPSNSMKLSYEYKDNGVYGEIWDSSGNRRVTYYNKDRQPLEYAWFTKSSAEEEVITQIHLLYKNKYDSKGNLTEQIATKIKVENYDTGKYKEEGIDNKIVNEYEYYNE